MAQKKAVGDGPLKLTLAHPLPGAHAARLGLGSEDLNPGSEVAVDRDAARTLGNAGLVVGYDPEDQSSVQRLLDPATAAKAPVRRSAARTRRASTKPKPANKVLSTAAESGPADDSQG